MTNDEILSKMKDFFEEIDKIIEENKTLKKNAKNAKEICEIYFMNTMDRIKKRLEKFEL